MNGVLEPISSAALSLPAADHGDIVSTLPFFLPALLIVGGLLAMRAIERRRNDPQDRP
jgi:hypothetical protein